MKANLKPTIHLGGVLNSISSNYKLGNKRYFITEACEYKDNYLYLKPDIAVVLNIDLDHLDYFKNIDNLKNSFLNFSKQVKVGGIVVISADDKNSKDFNNITHVNLIFKHY